ncbi:SURF1 family protein [Thermoactinospora rubra]|uniref:SURF1 family protein n=1 Tax=Thermoactinospora rubra TaxID=1088767 RepID=UPI000A10B69B|nr:SURF1 family protein [Thermoactinospora rubra]
MLRTLLAPRLLGLHIVAIGVLIAFILLGRWQLGVFEDSGRPRAAADPAPVAVDQLVKFGAQLDGEALGRRVTASGVYDGGKQLLVADRRPDVDAMGGRAARGAGYWVLTPLRLADGTLVPVVRAWTATPEAAPAVPPGQVAVTGRVRPSEATDGVRRYAALPSGQVATVSTAELINLWPGEKVRNGFVVADGSGVRIPPPQTGGELTWRNLAYALNWWIFAGFAVFMWFHFVRDAVRTARGEQWSRPSSSSERSPTSSA